MTVSVSSEKFSSNLDFAYILKHDQTDATLYNILYYCQRCTRVERFSAHHQELKSVHVASGICQTCMNELGLVCTQNIPNSFIQV
jgi:hypothetical protein